MKSLKIMFNILVISDYVLVYHIIWDGYLKNTTYLHIGVCSVFIKYCKIRGMYCKILCILEICAWIDVLEKREYNPVNNFYFTF